MPALRQAFLGLAGLMLLGVVVQFLLAGFGIFGVTDDFDAHETMALVLHVVPLLMLIVGLVARMPKAYPLMALGLLVLVTIQSGLPSGSDFVASLHPLVALVIFVLAHELFQRARRGAGLTPAP